MEQILQLVSELNNALESFKIPAVCVNWQEFRHFSFFDLKLMPGCRINKLSNFSRELALALRAKSAPILKPLTEKGVVRLQMVFKDPEPIYLNQIWKTPPAGTLPFLWGETDEGKACWVDMATNPHLLVAGTTGSGKSSFLHLLIANALKRNDVRLFLVDTKQVEFGKYQNQVQWLAQNYTAALSMLGWLVEEMERRYQLLAKMHCTSIQECPYMDKILVVVDELADLMLLGKKKEFETLICRLAQKARAAGIYLVCATQRPSVDIITGTIKANFPARLVTRVASRADSQVVFDASGGEHLLGKGDALFKSPAIDSLRLQIALP